MTRFALLGLGEAGTALATDLAAAGGEVSGFDPVAGPAPEGVTRHDDPWSAVAGAQVVMAVTPMSSATDALESVVTALPADALYADLSTSSPRLKRRLAAKAAAAGVAYVDVALMAPVPGRGLRTPALVAGPAAGAFAATMGPLGMPVDVVGPEAGQAVLRKLLRSVVMKGLAQLLIEALDGAEAAGVLDEVRENLVSQLSSLDEALVHRLVTGTPQHARRRLEEMEATIELLDELGVDPAMSTATAARLSRMVTRPAGRDAPTGGGCR